MDAENEIDNDQSFSRLLRSAPTLVTPRSSTLPSLLTVVSVVVSTPQSPRPPSERSTRTPKPSWPFWETSPEPSFRGPDRMTLPSLSTKLEGTSPPLPRLLLLPMRSPPREVTGMSSRSSTTSTSPPSATSPPRLLSPTPSR